MSPSSTESTTGQIIAGSGDNQETFNVQKETLERSPIIREWIKDPSSMPDSLRWNQALYLRNCQPDVVRLVIRYLERDLKSSAGFDIDNEAYPGAVRVHGPVFYVRVYKLAGSLALDQLCANALCKIQAHKYTTDTFIKTILEAEAAKLLDGRRFCDWIVRHVTQNAETLRESKLFRSTIQEGGEKSWLICSALMSTLSHSQTPYTMGKESTGETTFNPPLTPPSSSSKHTSSRPDSSSSSDKRKTRTHSHISSSPLGPRLASDGAGVKKRKTKRERLSAYVEDGSE